MQLHRRRIRNCGGLRPPLSSLSRSAMREREEGGREKDRVRRRGQVGLADSRHAATGKPGDVLHCDATDDVYRPSIIQRHVPVIAYSACNITKHTIVAERVNNAHCRLRASPAIFRAITMN